MPEVKNIQLSDIKHVLGYAVKYRRGYRHDIDFIDGKLGRTVDNCIGSGLVHGGQTMHRKTWSITDLGDKYYKDLFGNFSYYGKRVAGFLSKLLN